MTLKEKFENIEIMLDGKVANLNDDEFCESPTDCIKIADDYAIKFAEWLVNSSYFFNIGMKEMTFEQVLEIFKKEQKWK